MCLCMCDCFRIMLQILQETDQDEVEFDKSGSWKPVEKSEFLH